MGGRGSAGGKGGGRSSGGGSISDLSKKYEIDSRGFTKVVQSKLSEMTDKELNRTVINSRNLMNNENAKLAFERNKLKNMVDDFKKTKSTDPKFNEKWETIEKQMAKVNERESYANTRTQIHYLAINEKYNVRHKK
jgi:hypothetical protein